MKIRFVDPPKHYRTHKKEYDAALHDCLGRGDLILRKDVEIFEQRFAKFVGTRYAVGVNSGFDALHLSLRAAGIGPGDEVITVAHTFVATIAAIVHTGAKPILIDVGADCNMDVSQIKSALSKKTKAIIPVHLNGRICDMGEIMDIAKKHSLIVIEDAAQALGAMYRNKRAGSFGATGCFSLYPFKILGAFGDAGMVTTNSNTVAQTVRMLRDHGQDRGKGIVKFYGFNARLDNVQAAILNVKFNYYPSWIKRRRAIAKLYYKELHTLSELALPHFEGNEYFDVYQNYVIRAQRRDELKAYLAQQGIEMLISWPKPLHYQKNLGLSSFKLPETVRLCKEVLSLPLNTELTDTEVETVASAITKFYNKKQESRHRHS